MITGTRCIDRAPDLSEMIRRRDLVTRRSTRQSAAAAAPHKHLRRLIRLRDSAMRSATRPGEV